MFRFASFFNLFWDEDDSDGSMAAVDSLPAPPSESSDDATMDDDPTPDYNTDDGDSSTILKRMSRGARGHDHQDNAFIPLACLNNLRSSVISPASVPSTIAYLDTASTDDDEGGLASMSTEEQPFPAVLTKIKKEEEE